MDKQEWVANFVNSVERERVARQLTQKQMAAKLGMSISAYKKMISGETEKLDLYLAYQMYTITGRLLGQLCGLENNELQMLEKIQNLSSKQSRFVSDVIDFELQFQRKKEVGKDYVTMMIPTGNLEDGMIWDSANLSKINVHNYRKKLGQEIHCAIKVTSNHLHPAYHEGDILLICKRPPRDGDTGIFVNKDTGRAYIRRFKQTNPCQLIPISDTGETFYVDPANQKEMEQWIKFGIVLTKMREE